MIAAGFGPQAIGAGYTDDFSAGLSSLYWTVISNQPLYNLATDQGTVRFSKPMGGDYTLQYIGAQFRTQIEGDFDVRLDFQDASIDRQDGSPGNQVQLNIGFGSEFFSLVFSDEGYLNVHVWDGAWRGAQAYAQDYGTFRITRTGAHVAGYINETLVYEANYNDQTTTLSFTLQNNGTRDATTVTYDNFVITADALIPPWPVITSPTTAAGQVNRPFSYAITATGEPTSYGAEGLPAGLVLEANSGLISGTLDTPGQYTIALSATNDAGSDTQLLILQVADNWPVQWRSEEGGNGHWYQAIWFPSGINWEDAQTAAVQAGGYLATSTSAPENALLYDLVDSPEFWFIDTYGNGGGPWLGGWQPPGSPEPGGQWQWINGDPWDYSAWAANEPNNAGDNQDRLCFFGVQTLMGATWDDRAGASLEKGYLVEYDADPRQPRLSIRLLQPDPLSVHPDTTKALVQWPGVFEAYGLESTPDLTRPVWQPVPETPVLVFDQWTVTNTLMDSSAYYRLRR